MAWLHLESREFDCRPAAWPLALPQLTRNYSNEGRKSKHTLSHSCCFCNRLSGYILNQKCSRHKQPGPLLPATFSVPRIRMERRTCMWRMQVGGSDVSRIWQDRSGTASSQRAASQKHMQGTCASHLKHRHGLICPCWDQSTAAKAWGYREDLLPDERLRNIKDKQKNQVGQKHIACFYLTALVWM